MGAWILILTIGGSTSQSGVSVSQHEYTTKQNCLTAGNMWLKGVQTFSGDKEAVCVPK